jgi:hypothetical protein
MEEGECGFNGEGCLDLWYLWDPTWYSGVADPKAAEQAFLLLLSNPEYFAALYTDPEAWAASEEGAHLDVFLQYSVLHTTTAGFISAGFDPDVAADLQAAHGLHGVGDEAGRDALLAAAGVTALPELLTAAEKAYPKKAGRWNGTTTHPSTSEAPSQGHSIAFPHLTTSGSQMSFGSCGDMVDCNLIRRHCSTSSVRFIRSILFLQDHRGDNERNR